MTWYDPKSGERKDNDTNLEDGFGRRYEDDDKDEPQSRAPVVQEAPQLTERSQFEQWAVKHLGDERFLIRDTRQPDKYDAYLMDHLWLCWQTRAKIVAQAPLPQVQEAPQPLESRPSEDAFESAWRECNANGNAGGWERIAFISGFEKGFKAAQAPLREAAKLPNSEDFTGYSVRDDSDGSWLISLNDFMADWIRRYGKSDSSVLREAATPRKSDYCRDCRQPVTGSVHVEMVTGQKICFRCFKRMGEPQKIEGPAQEALADSSAPKEK